VDSSAPNIEFGMVAPGPNVGLGVDVSSPNVELGMVALGPVVGPGVDVSAPNLELGVVAPGPNHGTGHGLVRTQFRVGRDRARAQSWDWTPEKI